MSSQNNIVMNIETMFEGLKGNSRQKLDGVAKLFAKTFDRFAKPFGINIDKNSIKTIEDLENKFRELGVTATQVGNQISLSMKTADGKFVSTSFQYEGGVAGKGKARLTQGATIQTASYLKPTEQLRRNYENVIKARKELDSLEQKGFSKTSDTWQKAEKSLEAYNTQLEETIESLKQRYNLTVNQDPNTKEFVWGNGKGQLETLGRKYQHSMDYQALKKQDTANIEAQRQAVQQYVSALQTQYREEEKLVRLQQAKAPKQVIQAQQEVVNETRKQTQAVEQQAKSSEEYTKVEDKVTLAEKKHKQTLAELTNTTQKSVSIFGKFKETLKQVVSAGLSWKIFSAITQTVKKTIDTVEELDKSLVDLQIATGSTRVQAEELLHTYNQMAKELGATTQEVASAADSWLRQGYSTEQTNELIRSSMVLSKIGQIESAEATQYLTSALKGFDVEAEKSIEIVDKLAAIDLISATNASGLAEALSRTAASANLAGVEMEQLLGYVAVVGETTQKSMSSVGESFKTIFARFGNIKAGKFVDGETGESLNDVAKVLSDFNIQLYDAQGNMNDVGDILDTLGNKWDSLIEVEQNALATAIAGTKQRENFIVLMDNYRDAIKYTEEALNSSGTAMEKYDAYLQSIEASQAKLKATFEEFSQTLVDKGIIKGFYDLVNAGVETLTMLVKLKPLLTVIGTLIFSKLVVSGFGKLKELKIKKIFIDIIDKLDLMRLGLIDDTVAIKKNVHSFKDLVNGLKNGTISMKNFKTATDASMSSISKWQLLITLVTLAISAIISSYKKYQQQLEENAEKAKENREETENQIKTIKDLEEEYEKLQSKTVLDETDQERIVQIEKELNEQIKLINQKIEEGNNKELEKLETLNLQNGEYTKQKNILSQLDETTSKILANEAKSEKIAQQKKVQGKVGGKTALSYSLAYPPDYEVGKILEEAFGVALQNGSDFGVSYAFNFSSNADEMIDQLKALQEARDYYLGTYTDEELMNNAVYNSIVSTINKYKDLIEAYETAALKYWQADINKEMVEDFKSSDYIEGDTYKIVDSKEAMEAYIAQLQEEAKIKNGGVAISEAYAQAIRDAVENAFPQFIEGSEEATNATLGLQYTLEDVKNTYEVLNSAISEYNSNGSISYDTWEKLIEVEDQYLSILVDEEGQIKANNKTLQDLMKAKIEDATLTRMETYVNNLLTAAQQGNLDKILLSTEGLNANTNARVQNIMAVIASNPELMKHSEVILQNLSAMAQLTNTISLGSNSTKDAKDATEDWEKVLDYANAILDEQIEKLEKEQEALEKLTEEKIKAHEAEIKRLEEEKEALEEKNEEKNKELELEELERNLQKAKQRTMRVYHEGKGWVWEQDPEALQEAQQELDDFHTEQQIENIEDLIEAEEEKIEELENNLDKEIEGYKERIKAIKDYKDEWNKVKEEHEKAQNEIIAKAKLGADAEKEILMGKDGRLKVLDDFKEGYTKALGEVAKKTEESVTSINTSLGKFDFETLRELLNGSGKTEDGGKFGNYKFVRGEEDENGVSIKYVLDKDSGRYYKEADLAEWRDEYYYTKGTSYFGKAYASGTLSAKSGIANVDEKGNELIVPKKGRYRMMEYGDTVVPHNFSQRLFEVASNPLRFIANALNSVKTPNLMSNSNQVSNSSIIHIGTIELPSVTNGENFVRQLQLIAANR